MTLIDDIQTYLQELSPPVIDGDSGWPSSRRQVHDHSNRLVILTEDGGPSPETPAPAGLGDSALKELGIQVRVRGAQFEGDQAAAKANEIWGSLHGILRRQIGDGFYLRIKAQTSGPVYIGNDSKGRPEFTISFLAVQAV